MGRVMRVILIALNFILPWVVRAVIFMGKLIITSVISFWIGVPESVRRMVDSWMEAAWNANVPTEYGTILHWIFTIVAYGMIFLGWISFSYLTVFLLSWIL